MVDDPPLALMAPAVMDAHAYPAMPLSVSLIATFIDGMSNTHPRLLQTHDGLAAETYIHQSAIPHAGVGLHTRRAFNVGEPVVCMRRPMHVRSWKDADAWVSINELKGADIVIRLNSRSFFLDEAVPMLKHRRLGPIQACRPSGALFRYSYPSAQESSRVTVIRLRCRLRSTAR